MRRKRVVDRVAERAPEPEKVKPKKTMVRWTDEEWDSLATLVYMMRRNSPDSLCTLANRAQRQFPQGRQRPGVLTTACLEPLVERIQKKDREVEAIVERCRALEQRVEAQAQAPVTRQEILTALSDDEIREYFLPRLFRMITPAEVVTAFPVEALVGAIETAEVVALVARRLVTDIINRPLHITVQMPEHHQASVVKTGRTNGRRRKKIAIIGTKGDQPRFLLERVIGHADLVFIEVDKLHPDTIPSGADHVILWFKFASHAHRDMVYSKVEPARVIEHFGGLDELGERLERLCGLRK